MRLGFIGLGQMGKHCASNLLKKQGQLIVSDANPEALTFLVEQGAQAVSSPAELSSLCDTVFLCLPNGDIVEKVIFGPNGLSESFRKGQIIVDLSTVDFIQTQEIADKVEAMGVSFMDAPISGLDVKAKSGELSIMCGGKEEIFKKMLPCLENMGTSIVYLGKHGMGQLSKTINNILYNINMAGLAEILPFAVKMGLEPEKIAQFVNSGTGRSHASEYFLPRILEGNFSYGFTMESAYKDMQTACIVSVKEKIPTPVLHAAMTTYQMTLLEGFGKDYKGAMIKTFERLLKVYFRKKKES